MFDRQDVQIRQQIQQLMEDLVQPKATSSSQFNVHEDKEMFESELVEPQLRTTQWYDHTTSFGEISN